MHRRCDSFNRRSRGLRKADRHLSAQAARVKRVVLLKQRRRFGLQEFAYRKDPCQGTH